MQKMYDRYKDIVEFRLVYINEAHAADSDRSVPYAKELGINNHKNYGERCDVAGKLLSDKNLTIPTVIDGMDNKVGEAYSAWPDRIYVVRKDGTLGVASGRGPWGFVPALEQTGEWLAEFKKSGKELELETKPGQRRMRGGRRRGGGERPTRSRP